MRGLVLLSGLAIFALAEGSNITVLVFGDSWGDLGPSYREVQDMFTRHGVNNADVRSAAIGGTTACGWAKDSQAIVKAARQKFPELPNGPDFVWYTAGGNDMGYDDDFHSCSAGARSMDDQYACMQTATDRIIGCTSSMFDAHWKAFPSSKVMQCNYDVPCEDLYCRDVFVHNFLGSHCGGNITCLNTCAVHWEHIYVGKLQTVYPEPRYTGLLIGGAVQKAAKVPGADVGKPVLDVGGPCDMMAECIHPKYGTAAATAVGEAFWDLYFSKYAAADPAGETAASGSKSETIIAV